MTIEKREDEWVHTIWMQFGTQTILRDKFPLETLRRVDH